MMPNQNNPSRKKSKTSSFGVSKRESHDASHFYNSKLYQTLPKPKKLLTLIIPTLYLKKLLITSY